MRDWLKEEGLALHKIEKNIAGGSSPDRDAQFLRIDELRDLSSCRADEFGCFLMWVEPGQGLLFDTLGTVVSLMRKAATRTGLKTTVNVIRREYEKGRSVALEFKENMPILFDDLIPKWNYRAVPQ